MATDAVSSRIRELAEHTRYRRVDGYPAGGRNRCTTLYRDVLASSYPVDGITPEKAIEQPGVDGVEAVELAKDAVQED